MLFSIGHSNHTFDAFLDLLLGQQIQVLVDIRSFPYSNYTPHFNKGELKAAIMANNLKYLFMGKELGGRPDGLDLYDPFGHALYWKIAQTPLFQGGLARLENGSQQYRVAMMCSEEDPSGCHRHLLVSRVLAEHNLAVTHIRGNGTLQSEAALKAAEGEHKQLSLFPDDEQYNWKSLLPILPKK